MTARVALDARYLLGRPSGIGAYVQAIAERAPGLRPDWQFDLWLKRGAPSTGLAGGNVSERSVNAAANSLPTALWPTWLVDFKGIDLYHATFNILGRGIPSRVVTTVHDLMWMLHPAWCEGVSLALPFTTAFYSASIMNALRRSQRIIAISAATADSIGQHFPKAKPKVRVVHHGVEPRFRPPASEAGVRAALAPVFGDRKVERYLLVVGQNAPSKNHPLILEAFAKANLPQDVSLVLVQRLYQRGRWGFSGEPELAKKARQLGILDRVVWLERVTDADVVHLFQGALGLVQFSKFEGFGMPVLEAIACGTPVVASDIAPLVEVLGGAALHAHLDVPSLADALRRLATNPALEADLRGRGLERARAFSWERCAREHVEVYEEALEAP